MSNEINEVRVDLWDSRAWHQLCILPAKAVLNISRPSADVQYAVGLMGAEEAVPDDVFTLGPFDAPTRIAVRHFDEKPITICASVVVGER